MAKYTERNVGMKSCCLTQTAIVRHSQNPVHVAYLPYAVVPDVYSACDYLEIKF